MWKVVNFRVYGGCFQYAQKREQNFNMVVVMISSGNVENYNMVYVYVYCVVI